MTVVPWRGFFLHDYIIEGRKKRNRQATEPGLDLQPCSYYNLILNFLPALERYIRFAFYEPSPRCVRSLDGNGACRFDRSDRGRQYTYTSAGLCIFCRRIFSGAKCRKHHVNTANCWEIPLHVHSLGEKEICKSKY